MVRMVNRKLTSPGIYWIVPKTAMGTVYRKSVVMGDVTLSVTQFSSVLEAMRYFCYSNRRQLLTSSLGPSMWVQTTMSCLLIALISVMSSVDNYVESKFRLTHEI